MCGILFILSYDSDDAKDVHDSLLPLLHHRGPDGHHKCSITNANGNEVVTLQFDGTVLHLRGELTKQPLVSDAGHIFLWNGEIFGGDVEVPADANDTTVLFDKLRAIPFETEGYHVPLVSLFQTIHGPWAFVFYDAVNKNIWYGRDYFGRRSLMSRSEEKTFVLSSLGHRMYAEQFSEVPAKALYCLNVEKLLEGGDVMKSIETFPMQSFNVNTCKLFVEHRCLEEYETNRTVTNASDENNAVNGTANHDGPKLNDVNTKTKCCNCITLNNSRDVCMNGDTNAFSNHENDEPTRTKSKEYIDDVKQSPSSCSTCTNSVEQHNDMSSLETIRREFLSVLEEAVRKRVFNIPRCRHDNEEASKVGILFSGGIDSAVLTALAHRCVPPHEPIDLINVAFAQKQKVQQNVKKKNQKTVDDNVRNFNVPDRVTGRTALKELSRERKWNFIEVDVTLEELQEARTSTITNLVYPLDSVLDDSIGCAIWFAARGVGRCYNLCEDGSLELTHENYKCPVKVLLTGMGADEQLGGYARHRTKFQSFSWTGLADEMKMELERISSRNLGRDDRCISDHGREARFPFLDENVVSFLQRLPVCVKCDPRLPRGYGEKILLREAAAALGLHYASNLPKRAIQFGSKIAKLEGSKEKGGDNCKRLGNVQIS